MRGNARTSNLDGKSTIPEIRDSSLHLWFKTAGDFLTTNFTDQMAHWMTGRVSHETADMHDFVITADLSAKKAIATSSISLWSFGPEHRLLTERGQTDVRVILLRLTKDLAGAVQFRKILQCAPFRSGIHEGAGGVFGTTGGRVAPRCRQA